MNLSTLSTKGSALVDSVERFKEEKSPSILVTPSGWEGIDFPDEQCRFIIIVKSPYPNLSDERIKFISSKYKDSYDMMTLTKLIQGMGRGTRHINDYCKIYVIDSSTKRLFNNRKNIWFNEFSQGSI